MRKLRLHEINYLQKKKKKKNRHTQQYCDWQREKEGEEEQKGDRRWWKRDLTLGDESMTQRADDGLQGCTLETCMVLATEVTPINSIKKKKLKSKIGFGDACTTL